MDMNWIGLLREEGRVFRSAVEKCIAHELAEQAAVANETGKAAKVQSTTLKALRACADTLDSMANLLPEHGKPSTTTAANGIDRMTTDFAATSADLRALADGSLRALAPDEKLAHEEAAAAAAKALAEAEAEVARLSRHADRVA